MVDLRQKRARCIEFYGLEHALIKVTTVKATRSPSLPVMDGATSKLREPTFFMSVDVGA